MAKGEEQKSKGQKALRGRKQRNDMPEVGIRHQWEQAPEVDTRSKEKWSEELERTVPFEEFRERINNGWSAYEKMEQIPGIEIDRPKWVLESSIWVDKCHPYYQPRYQPEVKYKQRRNHTRQEQGPLWVRPNHFAKANANYPKEIGGFNSSGRENFERPNGWFRKKLGVERDTTINWCQEDHKKAL